MRGNVIDLALGLIISAVFVTFVTFVSAIITPILNAFAGSGAPKGLHFYILSGNDKTFVDLSVIRNSVMYSC